MSALMSPNPEYPDPALRLERVGSPYTPKRLESLGRLPEIPPCPRGFDPASDHEALYRIWGAHGFVGVREWTIGYLSIRSIYEMKATDSDGTVGAVRFEISQRVAYLGGIVHSLDAEAVCNIDTLFTLDEWTLRSRISRTDGAPQPELDLDFRFRIGDGAVERECGDGCASSIDFNGPLTSDWTLFQAVERMPFDAATTAERSGVYSIMDGFRVYKPGHRLYFDEGRVERLSDSGLELVRFYQIGTGVLPYEYWLDGNHRLTAVISGNRAWLLDDGAEDAFERNLESLRKGDGYAE